MDITHPYYADSWFKVSAVETFTVSPDFPAIRHSTLPDGVDRVRYSLDRNAIAPFLVATEWI